jgi:hypothetical protein
MGESIDRTDPSSSVLKCAEIQNTMPEIQMLSYRSEFQSLDNYSPKSPPIIYRAKIIESGQPPFVRLRDIGQWRACQNLRGGDNQQEYSGQLGVSEPLVCRLVLRIRIWFYIDYIV